MLLFSQICSVRRSILILFVLQFVPARPGNGSGSLSKLSLPQHWKDTLKAKLESLPGEYTDLYKRLITNLITVRMYLKGIYFLGKGYDSAKSLPEEIMSNPLTNEPDEYSWSYIVGYPLLAILHLSEPEEYLSLMEQILQLIDKLKLWRDNSEDHKRVHDDHRKSEQESFQNEEKDLEKWKREIIQIWKKNMKLKAQYLKDKSLKERDLERLTLQRDISQSLQHHIEPLVECMVKQLAKTDVMKIEVYEAIFDDVKQKEKFLEELIESCNVSIEGYVEVFSGYNLQNFKGVTSEELNKALGDASKDALVRHAHNATYKSLLNKWFIKYVVDPPA